MAEELGFDDEVRRLLKREPFWPFQIVTSGDRYEVTDPSRVAWNESLVVVLHPKQGMSFFRKSQIVGVDAHESAA